MIQIENFFTKSGYFDAVKVSNILKSAKNNDTRSEIIAQLIASMHDQVLSKKDAENLLATKKDLKDLELKISAESKDHHKWQIGVMFTCSGIIIATISLIIKLA